MINAVGYVRVSTRSQNYETQTDMIKKFCEMRGYNLLRIFDDVATGKNTDRDGYIEMEKALEKNMLGIEVLVVTKLDRIGRNLRDLLKFVDFLQNKKVNLVAIGSSVDTTTKEGRLFLYIAASFAEYERELINERTDIGRKAYIAKGGKLGRKKLKIPTDEIKRLKMEGVPITKISDRFNVSRMTIYKRLEE